MLANTDPNRYPDNSSHYHIKFKRLSLNLKAVVLNNQGQPIFSIEGQVNRLGKTVYLFNLVGNLQYIIRKISTGLHHFANIYQSGEIVAEISRRRMGNLIMIKVFKGGNLKGISGIKPLEYCLFRREDQIAHIFKEEVRLGDYFFVYIDPAEDYPLILAIASGLIIFNRSFQSDTQENSAQVSLPISNPVVGRFGNKK